MSKADLIKQQLGITRMVFDGTMADVTEGQCAKLPGGVAHPIGATLAHSVMSEDFVVNMMVKGGQPLMMGAFANKTGVSEPQPMPGGDTFGWSQRVKVDMPALKEYAKAVFAATDEYVGGLSDEELDKMREAVTRLAQRLKNIIAVRRKRMKKEIYFSPVNLVWGLNRLAD